MTSREGTSWEATATDEEAGLRLERFLTMRLAATRSRLQRLIRTGQVQLNGAPTRPSAQIHTGDRIVVEIPAPTPAAPRPQALPIDIVYEDPDLVVVDKPAGMVVHPGAGHGDGTLVNALLHHVRDLSGIGGELRPGIVHRLDRGTSGLLVVAKHDASHAELARQFKAREVEKTYVVVVWGVVRQGRRIDLPIGRDRVDRKRISARTRRARSAVTRVTRAEPVAGMTLAEVTIATGRTHQIRVHLSTIGHPVAGDVTYGGRRRHAPPALRDAHRIVKRLNRPFLHAARLAFTHPRDGRRLAFRSALPDDLQQTVDALRTAGAAQADRKVDVD